MSRPPALLIIDVQQGLDDPYYGARNNPAAERRMAELLAAWRAAGRPVLHAQHLSLRPGSPLREGAPGSAIKPEVQPLPGEPVFRKHQNSAFIGTDLDLRLRRLGARHVVAFGISTDMCVSTTVRTGANMGWDMVLVDDACDCFDLPDGKGGLISAKAVQAAHVATLGFEFCKVVSTAEVLSN